MQALNWLRTGSQSRSMSPLDKFKALYDLSKEALEGAHREDSEGRPERALKLYATGLEAIQEALAQPGVHGSGGREGVIGHTGSRQGRGAYQVADALGLTIFIARQHIDCLCRSPDRSRAHVGAFDQALSP